MIQQAGHKLKQGMELDFQKYFSLTMVIILNYFQQAPASLKSEIWYDEQRQLLEKSFQNVKDGKGEDPFLFDKFLNICTRQADRYPRIPKKAKLPKLVETKTSYRPTAHAATQEMEHTEDMNQTELFQQQLQQFMTAYSVSHGQSNSPGSKGSYEKKRNYETSFPKKPASAENKRDPGPGGIPEYLEKKLTPYEDSKILFTTLTDGKTRLSGPITHSDKIWMKFQQSKEGQPSKWITVPYLATKDKCENCTHNPRCFQNGRPCRKCGYHGHSRCLHKTA
jgi:hypothetical protein